MSKLFGLSLFSFLSLGAYSQVSFSVQQPPSVIIQKSQLWNITLINSGNSQMTVSIDLNVFDTKSDQRLMTAHTRQLTLNKGIRQLNAADLSPIDYRYLTSAFDLDRVSGALLPVGDYRACYTILSENKSGV